jgi:hypothetical protein
LHPLLKTTKKKTTKTWTRMSEGRTGSVDEKRKNPDTDGERIKMNTGEKTERSGIVKMTKSMRRNGKRRGRDTTKRSDDTRGDVRGETATIDTDQVPQKTGMLTDLDNIIR